jgi:hypothetical protein
VSVQQEKTEQDPREVMAQQMAQVYMTDPVCRQAVEANQAKYPALSLVEAAKLTARTVRPAPNYPAAQDARYLLAPGSLTLDEQALDAQMAGYGEVQSAEVYAQEAERDARDFQEYHQNVHGDPLADRPEVELGPIPPHPTEARDEREAFTVQSVVNHQQALKISQSSSFGLGHQHGVLCEAVNELEEKITRAGRIALGPLFVLVGRNSARAEAPGWILTLTIDTIPARGRESLLLFSYDEERRNEDRIEYVSNLVAERPQHELVVHRSPTDPRFVSGVVYRPAGRDIEDESPDGMTIVVGAGAQLLTGTAEQLVAFIRQLAGAAPSDLDDVEENGPAS